MTIEHSVITDPYIHEPKGVAAAAADLVYTTNGSGSGTFKAPTPKAITTALSSATTSVQTVDFTTYSSYKLYLYIQTNVGLSITMDGSSNAGTSYQTTTYRSVVTGTTAGTSTSSLNNSWTANKDLFVLHLSQPTTAGPLVYTMIGNNQSSTVTGGGNFNMAAAVNRVRFSFSSNIDGTIILIPETRR